MLGGPINDLAMDNRESPAEAHVSGYLLSRRHLQQALGVIWLVDGLLQLQPVMWTTFLTTGLMQPLTQGQPGPIASALQSVIQFTASNLILVNATIAVVQLALGILLLGGWFIRATLVASIIWSLIVWFGGEGFGLLLTGQSSALTGAPGAVILYLVLGLAAYPTDTASDDGLLSRRQLRLLLAGFWALAAVLQLQPFWWQDGQISGAISNNLNPGTLNGTLLDGLLQTLANATATVEVALNVVIIVVALVLAVGLALVRTEQSRPLLAASIVLSLVLWVVTEGAGQLLSGSATDFNSGLPLAIVALACWPMVEATTAGYRQAAAQSRT
jgi:hypothetical protein